MHIFDYSFLKTNCISSKVVNMATSIYSLKALSGIRKLNNVKIFTELEKIAKIQSVKNSNAIEGIITSDERIKAIVTKSSAPLNHDEAEIAGYRDALNEIHTNGSYIGFNERDILHLHEIMLSFTGYEYGGAYKDTDNAIIEIDASGNRKIRFSPTPASETKKAMEQLVLAYTEAINDSGINKLLLIPCVILDFLCIHPFSDGNGRMSRILSLLLLYKNGFDVCKYVSFEEQINKNKNYYYEALRLSSMKWHENASDYFPFIENFLSMLYFCYKELDKRFAVVHDGKVSKKYRIEATVLNSLAPLSKSEICEILPDVSPTTIEAVLGKMVKNGQIIKLGTSRNTKYLKKS